MCWYLWEVCNVTQWQIAWTSWEKNALCLTVEMQQIECASVHNVNHLYVMVDRGHILIVHGPTLLYCTPLLLSVKKYRNVKIMLITGSQSPMWCFLCCPSVWLHTYEGVSFRKHFKNSTQLFCIFTAPAMQRQVWGTRTQSEALGTRSNRLVLELPG